LRAAASFAWLEPHQGQQGVILNGTYP